MTDEQKKMLLRIITAAILLVVVACVPLPYHDVWFLLPYLLIGYDVLWSALRNIFHGELFDEEFLMALATVGALAIGEYPEAVAVMLFFQLGELIQDLAVGKSRRSIAALMDIRPDHANVLRNGEELAVDPEEVQPGELILIRPGERIPLDGVIVEGATSVNTAALTGESRPRSLTEGENVISGAINLTALIRVRVSSAYADSTVSRILELVENSAARKAKTENFITRFARYYTPCVVAAALLLALLPPLLLHGGWSLWLNRALILLVVSCPCALVISVPLSFFGGIGGASRQGVLIKGSNYLEALSHIDTVVFDKTGTLTHGNFSVTDVHPQEISVAELLDIAALAESYSHHPIAESIVRAHQGHIDKSRVSEISEQAGRGISAVIDGRQVLAGNDKLLESAGISWRECHHTGTIVHVAIDGQYCGHIVIADEIKSDAAAAIAALKQSGVRKTVMLTGDIPKVGEAVARQLQIDECHCGLLPDAKVAEVEQLLSQQEKGCTLAFVGDGVNDAPVLSRADVGIAMGALGSDAAIESADVVLMDDQPVKIATAIRIARKTMRIVRQNIIFALAIKALVLVGGAFGLANMWFAVFADVGVTIIAVLNALRALQLDKEAAATAEKETLSVGARA